MHAVAFTRPATSVPAKVGFLGLFGLGCGVALLLLFHWPKWSLPITLIVGAGAPMWYAEFRRHRPHGDRQNSSARQMSPVPWTDRLSGLLLVLLVWSATLALFSLADVAAIGGFWDIVFAVWPVAVLVFAWIVHRAPPNCGLDQLGHSLQAARRDGWRQLHWHILRDHLVKAFFLPLMLGFTAGNAALVTKALIAWSDLAWFTLPMTALYLIDVTFGTIGYLSTFRRLGAHIRSSNPYWSGWISALVCYPPFFTFLGLLGLSRYKSGPEWHQWLSGNGPLIYVWGGAILVLTAIYVWATVAFGIRFSNLTNRGIITNGPYRWTKHPAYIAKNLSWWLIFTPFFSELGVLHSLLGCLTLLIVNGIYLARAKTEEKHLRADQTYRDYCDWIEEHGLFTRFGNFGQWRQKLSRPS